MKPRTFNYKFVCECNGKKECNALIEDNDFKRLRKTYPNTNILTSTCPNLKDQRIIKKLRDYFICYDV